MDPLQRNPVPTLIGLCLLAAAIVVLNILAIIVLLRGNRRKLPVEYPLLSLLVANGLEGLISVPAYAVKKYTSDKSQHACDVFRFTYFVCGHVALFSLLATSMERILALLFPLKYRKIVTKKRAFIGVVLIWSFVIILDIIPFFPGASSDEDDCHYNPQQEWSVAMITLTNIIPFPFLCANYIYIIRIAYKHSKKLSADMKNVKKKRKWSSRTVQNLQAISQLRATKRILIIISVYIICWGPSCIYYMLVSVCPDSCFELEENNLDRKQWIRFFLKLLVHLHALFTPIVFYWRSKVFRHQASEVLRLNEIRGCTARSLQNQTYSLTNGKDQVDSSTGISRD